VSGYDGRKCIRDRLVHRPGAAHPGIGLDKDLKMKQKAKTGIVIFSLFFLFSSTASANDKKKKRDDLVQVTFGVTYLDRDDSVFSAPSDDESMRVESTIDSLPTFGVMGQMPLWGDTNHAGIEAGVDGSWRRDTSRVVTSNGNILIRVDNTMYLINLYYGLYGSINLGNKARLYAGAGGMLNWGSVDLKSDSDTMADETESAFGFGPYARAGIEFALPNDALMGVGGRWISPNVDFTSSYGKIKIEGVQFMLTYSVPIPSGKL